MFSRLRLGFVKTGLVLMCGLMAASLFANGSEEVAGSANSAKTRKISVMLFDRGNVPNEAGTIQDNKWTNWIHDQMMDNYNIDVSYFIMPRSEEIAKVPILMASNSAPDITYHYGTNNIINWFNDGGIYDLSPYLSQYGQDIVANLGDDVLLDGRTTAGEQYAIPTKRSTITKFNVFIRKDWLDKLGMDVPETVAQLYTALKAFKEEDPGNVGKDQVIPYWPGYMTEYYFLKNTDPAAYAASYVNHWQYLDPGYKDSLEWQNKLYNEGLIDPEYFTDKGNSRIKEAFVTGKLGYFEQNVNFNMKTNYGSLLKNLQKNVEGAEFVSIAPIRNVNDGKVYNPVYPPSGGLSFVPKSSRNPEACVQYMNFIAGDGGFHVYFGFEGEHYNLVDGVPVAIDGDYNARDKDWINNDLALTFGMTEELFIKSVVKSFPGYESYVEDNYANALAGDHLNADHQPYDQEVNDLSAAVKKVHSDYQVKLITCRPGEFDTIWNEFQDEMEKAGADRIIELRKAMYGLD